MLRHPCSYIFVTPFLHPYIQRIHPSSSSAAGWTARSASPPAPGGLSYVHIYIYIYIYIIYLQSSIYIIYICTNPSSLSCRPRPESPPSSGGSVRRSPFRRDPTRPSLPSAPSPVPGGSRAENPAERRAPRPPLSGWPGSPKGAGGDARCRVLPRPSRARRRVSRSKHRRATLEDIHVLERTFCDRSPRPDSTASKTKCR